jgi:hypothetical protein
MFNVKAFKKGAWGNAHRRCPTAKPSALPHAAAALPHSEAFRAAPQRSLPRCRRTLPHGEAFRAAPRCRTLPHGEAFRAAAAELGFQSLHR